MKRCNENLRRAGSKKSKKPEEVEDLQFVYLGDLSRGVLRSPKSVQGLRSSARLLVAVARDVCSRQRYFLWRAGPAASAGALSVTAVWKGWANERICVKRSARGTATETDVFHLWLYNVSTLVGGSLWACS